MKRVMVLVLAVVAAAGLFAEAGEKLEKKQLTSLCFTAKTSDTTDAVGETTMASIGAAIDAMTLPGENSIVGVNVNASFEFPQFIANKPKGSTTTYYSYASDYDYFYNIDLTIGVLFYPVKKNNFYLGVGPAVSASAYFGALKGGTSGMNIQTGIGPDIDCCVRMGGSFYLTFGVIAKVDFYSFDLNDSGRSGTIWSTSAVPHIGFGIAR